MKKGFTLIELLVVITILAVLAGAALPYVQNYVEESRIAKAKTDLEEIARAVAVFETREGEYMKGDVSDLTGRYLNKAPIDPWGKPYVIATDSGLVVSGGPDRLASTSEDNIQSPYQPPLALVNAKWVDRNQSGAVDGQNASDALQITFSRRIATNTIAITDLASSVVAAEMTDLLKLSSPQTMTVQFYCASTTLLSNGRTLVFYVATSTNAFVPGSDTITVNSTPAKYFYDLAGNKCIASQAVKILPQ